MKQIKTILITFAIASLLPISLVGQDYGTTQYAISQVDVKIWNTISQRKINHENQEKINAFVTETSKWFKESSDIQNKINQAKSRSGDYGTFDEQRLQQEIQNLEQQQKSIKSLNGGVTIDSETYNSINELKNGLTDRSLEIVQLINEDEKLKNDLRALDIERDEYVADAEKDESTDQKNLLWDKIQYLKKKLKSNFEDYSRTSRDKVNPAVWCTKKDENSSLKCVHRNIYISALTETYIREIRKSGKEYDQNKLAEMIKNAQKQSIEVKKEATYMLREWYGLINAMEQEINALEQKYWNDDTNIDIDPSGCWVIVIGEDEYPKVRIEENIFGEYIAKLTNPGSLHKDYKTGEILFSVYRINATTFDGTEYSFSKSGATTRIPVRIIIQKNRKGIEYRTSDDLLTLRPCY